MINKMQKILFVIPAFNEEKIIGLFLNDLMSEALNFKNYKFEVVVIDDGSIDNTWNILSKKKQEISNFHAIKLSKNYGKEAALSAGIIENEGYDAYIFIDADYQFPLRYIREILKKWENGGEIVIGIKKNNKDINFIKKISSNFFNLFSKIILGKNHKKNESDFTLIDSKVRNKLIEFKEKNRVIRNLINLVGYEKKYFDFLVSERKAGRTKFQFSSLFKMFLNILIYYSSSLYKFIFYLSFLVFMIISIIIIFTSYQYFNGNYLSTSPTTILVLINTLLISVIFFINLVILLLLRSTHIEVQNRPLYIIKEKI